MRLSEISIRCGNNLTHGDNVLSPVTKFGVPVLDHEDHSLLGSYALGQKDALGVGGNVVVRLGPSSEFLRSRGISESMWKLHELVGHGRKPAVSARKHVVRPKLATSLDKPGMT